MTEDVVKKNRELYIEEFKATGHPGVDNIISYLDSHHFFESRCNGHDREKGGTANHSLWTLKFARETRDSILKKDPSKNIPDDELVFTCLLHDVCDCNPKHGMHGGRSREILEHRIKGFTFTLDVLAAVNSHMHSKLYGNKTDSTQNSKTKVELLHYLVRNSDSRAIEYASGIPYGTDPKRIFYQIINDEEPVIVNFDNKEHRYWWDTLGDANLWKRYVDLKNMPQTQAFRKAHLFISGWSFNADFSVLKDEKGNLALFVIRYSSSSEGTTLMASDKAGFVYTEFVAYVSRYPQYRPSYIVGRKTNGKWGIIRAKDQVKENKRPPIGITRQVDYEYDDCDSALNAMIGDTGHKIRVLHTNFFKKIIIR